MFYVFCGVVCQRQARITCQIALWDDYYLPQCLTSVSAATRAFAPQSEKLRLLLTVYLLTCLNAFSCSTWCSISKFHWRLFLRKKWQYARILSNDDIVPTGANPLPEPIMTYLANIFERHDAAATNFPASPRISGLGSLSVRVPSRTHNKVSEMSFFFSSCDSSSDVLW